MNEVIGEMNVPIQRKEVVVNVWFRLLDSMCCPELLILCSVRDGSLPIGVSNVVLELGGLVADHEYEFVNIWGSSIKNTLNDWCPTDGEEWLRYTVG
jgi:hypothetical protein